MQTVFPALELIDQFCISGNNTSACNAHGVLEKKKLKKNF
jgi:hypothetical protein